MHFGFALDSSDIDLWNIDLLDTHLDLLDTDIPSKHFVCLQDVFKVSWKTKNCYAEDVLKTCLKRRLKTFWRPTNVCWDAPKEVRFLVAFFAKILSYFSLYF